MATKRVLIDPDTNTEVSSAKKPIYTLETHIKDSALKLISLSHLSFHQSIIKDFTSYDNIWIGVQISNIVHSIYSMLRMEGKGTKNNLAGKLSKTSPTVTSGDKTYTGNVEDLKKLMTRCAEICGLQFGETHATLLPGLKWFGVAGPMFDFYTSFGLRLKELRLGHDDFAIRKDGDNIKSYPVSSYGLGRVHHVLLEGVRFPPERRSSMVQSLGPMTALLCYLNAQNGYEGKFLNACKRAMSHVPNIETVLKTMRTRKAAENRETITKLADILLMTTSRNANRAAPAPSILAALLTSEEERSEVTLANATDAGMQDAQITGSPLYRFDNGWGSRSLRKLMTLSGPGAAALYTQACLNGPYWLRGNFSSSQASQIVFHSWWGTFKEDFGVLRHITGYQN